MRSGRAKTCIAVFLALIFLGAALPCLCFAKVTFDDHHKTSSSNHDCCGSTNSDKGTNSNGSSHDKETCCSGCTLTVNSGSKEIIFTPGIFNHTSQQANVFLSSTNALFYTPKVILQLRRIPNTRSNSTVTVPSRLSLLSRWLI